MTADRSSEADRVRVVASAKRWLGTPYRHQASVAGVGTDCLGLIRGIWRDVIGQEPERPGAYAPDWAEATGEERLMKAALRHMTRLPVDAARPGDMLLFRMLDNGPAKHAAILVDGFVTGGTILHAYSGHSVCETRLTVPWRRRLAGAFRFPPSDLPTAG
ncbi:MAG: NlpC/P60 family protein [Pseudomonadota bacterium]